MEFKVNTTSTAATASYAAHAAAAPQSHVEALRAQAKTDRLELSNAALQYLKAAEEQRKAQEDGVKNKLNEHSDILEQLENAKESADAQMDALDEKMKCLKIAINIMSGKKVSLKDEQYLMEKDSKTYMMAKNMAILKKQEDEECESVLGDEEEEAAESTGASVTASSAGAEAPAEPASAEAAPAEPAAE